MTDVAGERAMPTSPRKRPIRRAVRRMLPLELGLDVDRRREMLADYLRLLAWWLGRPPMPALPPRLEQTLLGLLAGDAEKQVAARLGISVHTAHANVKELYRRIGVTSRGELMTRFLPTQTNVAPASATAARPRLP